MSHCIISSPEVKYKPSHCAIVLVILYFGSLSSLQYTSIYYRILTSSNLVAVYQRKMFTPDFHPRCCGVLPDISIAASTSSAPSSSSIVATTTVINDNLTNVPHDEAAAIHNRNERRLHAVNRSILRNPVSEVASPGQSQFGGPSPPRLRSTSQRKRTIRRYPPTTVAGF
ncbi:hypothetical protein EX30DRAFT_352036 [Ascodesmis nigricans]|uniref:Uncharacterized protein n=1 Tax=Ascodesmis nigricans TaxID=341454 RepID=A0A4S2MR31_9PEZI|nr:hypothetical protein EX30DRAFT_352036 [Ascodesmis nigricans]